MFKLQSFEEVQMIEYLKTLGPKMTTILLIFSVDSLM